MTTAAQQSHWRRGRIETFEIYDFAFNGALFSISIFHLFFANFHFPFYFMEWQSRQQSVPFRTHFSTSFWFVGSELRQAMREKASDAKTLVFYGVVFIKIENQQCSCVVTTPSLLLFWHHKYYHYHHCIWWTRHLYWNWINFFLSTFLVVHSNQHAKCKTISTPLSPPSPPSPDHQQRKLWRKLYSMRKTRRTLFGSLLFTFQVNRCQKLDYTLHIHSPRFIHPLVFPPTERSISTWQCNARIKLWRNGKWKIFFQFFFHVVFLVSFFYFVFVGCFRGSVVFTKKLHCLSLKKWKHKKANEKFCI